MWALREFIAEGLWGFGRNAKNKRNAKPTDTTAAMINQDTPRNVRTEGQQDSERELQSEHLQNQQY